jgi:hypothetical protein
VRQALGKAPKAIKQTRRGKFISKSLTAKNIRFLKMAIA